MARDLLEQVFYQLDCVRGSISGSWASDLSSTDLTRTNIQQGLPLFVLAFACWRVE